MITNKKRSALLGLAFGDAYGATTNFHSLEDIVNDSGPFGPEFPRPAEVTGSAQMSLEFFDSLNHNSAGDLDLNSIRGNMENLYVNFSLNQELEDTTDPQNQEAAYEEANEFNPALRGAVLGLIDNITTEEIARLAAVSAVASQSDAKTIYSTIVTALLVRDIYKEDLEPRKIATRAVEIAIDQMTETTYDKEVLGDEWEKAGADSPEAYHYGGWNEIIRLLRRARANAATTRKDEDWEKDPCSITGEGWNTEEAVATAVLIVAALGEDPGLALRRAATTNGNSNDIGAIVGIMVGANGFDWSQGWQKALDPQCSEEIERLVTN